MIILVMLWLLICVLQSPLSAEELFKCEDGPRYKIDVNQLKMKYSGKKFEMDLAFLSKFKVAIGIEDKSLQKASESTQQWEQFLIGLATMYNSCAITKKQFSEAISSLYPGMQKDSQRIVEISKKLERDNRLDNKEIKETKQLLSDFLEKLTKFAEISGKEEIINRICDKMHEEHEDTRMFLSREIARIGDKMDRLIDETTRKEVPSELYKLENVAKEMGLSLDDILGRLEDSLDLDKGMKALQQGRYDDAIIQFGKHADKSQKQAAQSYFQQGNAFAGKKDYEHAAEAFERSSLLDREYSYTWNNWGISLRQRGEYDKAMDKYEEALKHEPKNTYALFNWANLLAYLNRYPEAIEKYKDASKIHPEDTDIRYNWGISLYNWGNSLADQGNDKEAIDKYEEAVRYVPNNASIRFNYGLSLFKLQRYDDAIQKFQEALEYNPTHAEALYIWGNILMILSEGKDKTKLKEAIEKYKMATDYEPQHSRAWHNYGATLALLGDCEKAVEKYEKAIQYEPDYPTAWLGLIRCLNNLGRHAEAQEKLIEAKKIGVKLPF
jgi:tetratricopeptide (TPR) repeat protein